MSRWGSACSSLALVLAASAAGAEEPRPADAVVRVGERAPIAIMLISPAEGVGKATTSDIFRISTERLAARTNFEPKFVENPQLVNECEGRIACLVEKIRSDYERGRLLDERGEPRDIREHFEAMKSRPYPRYLVLIQSFARPGKPDRLSAILIDTDAALAALHHASRARQDWQRDLESAIQSDAVQKRAAAAEVSTLDEVQLYLTRLYDEDFRPAFHRTGNWDPYGAIRLRTNVAGVAILIDGRAVGTTVAGDNELIEVVAGPRKIGLDHPNYVPFEAQVIVEQGRAARLDVELDARGIGALRTGLLWTGVALAAVGVAVAGSAFVTEAGRGEATCFVPRGVTETCPARFVAFEAVPAPGDPAGRGVLIAPLGYSLAAVGLGLAGGALWEDGGFPWVGLVSGVVVGGAAYALSAALNPASSFPQ